MFHHLNGLFGRCFILTLVTFAFGVQLSRAECRSWERLKSARELAETTAKTLNGVQFPADLEAKMEMRRLKELLNIDLNFAEELDKSADSITAAEKARLAPYLVARKARDDADDALKAAEADYAKEIS